MAAHVVHVLQASSPREVRDSVVGRIPIEMTDLLRFETRTEECDGDDAVHQLVASELCARNVSAEGDLKIPVRMPSTPKLARHSSTRGEHATIARDEVPITVRDRQEVYHANHRTPHQPRRNVHMKTAIFVSFGVMFAALVGIALTSCKLDPAKVPPCTGTEKYPDPCAAAVRDAGVDG